ncbi:Protein-L-isoaspartate O-methyltransferase [Granulibacter bethesdensis]|uniref:Protein-L-isoaspartate O-methyltransferase n=1 Tax=Granulibacter bethesdensis TaxID=364410 RepID=A0AAC9K9S7_9PROT|nr:protein-L-isoaspartate O-methyltransferase [Granulibacter bethesdensis]APH54224.1 Protein-L-isoaspartate O-methyltransferase [Granulibacter bethesdensis]APH61809.1 Protein-L-isoaspartate O-methyltransferase [Granulibacter bethesdensis]
MDNAAPVYSAAPKEFQPPPTDARALMVDGQIRPNRVTDPRILAAMRHLPREHFLPEHLAEFAYIDDDIPLSDDRVMLKPLITARLLQLAAPVAGERCLVIGAGTGYGAAILASCDVSVVALEEDDTLRAVARTALGRHASAVNLVSGKLEAGCPEHAPWNLILIEGAVASIPEAVVSQLRKDGRLVTVLRPEGGPGKAVVVEQGTSGPVWVESFDCMTRLLPQFRAVPAFSF